MTWNKVKLGDILKQYRFEHIIKDDVTYKQVTISKHSGVGFRGSKIGKEIGRKRQFLINLDEYPNTLLFVRQGVEDGSIGIAPKEVNGCVVTENMPMFSVENIEVEYLDLVIKSKYFKELVNKIPTTGSAQKSIHEKQILDIEILAPSLEIQKKIVAKTLTRQGKINTLSTELSAQQNYLKNLRQALLQEAVQGKNLTTEDLAAARSAADYMPAAELLKAIKKEKAELAKQGKIKKEKPLPPITDTPFELPKDWIWCRLGEICGFITKGTTPDTSKIVSKEEIPYLKVYNIVNQKINFDYKPQFIDSKTHKETLTRSIIYPGDVLMNIVGPPLGKVAIVTNQYKEWNINQAIAFFRPLIIDINSFIYLHLCEGSEIAKIRTLGVVGQDNVSLEQCRNILFPLPPLPIQRAIVQRVEAQLLQIAALEKEVAAQRAWSGMLLQASLQEVLQAEV